MVNDITINGKLRHIDGHHMGDEVPGAMLTIHAPQGPHGLMAEWTGTLAIQGDPTFTERHRDKTFMFFAEQGVIYQPFDIRIVNGSGTVKLTMVPTMEVLK